MKVLHKSIGTLSEPAAGVARLVDELTRDYQASLTEGWTAIIEMQERGRDEPLFWLELQNDQGGGEFARTKLQTLQQFPDLPATGCMQVDELVQRLNRLLDTQEMSTADAGRLQAIITSLYKKERITEIPHQTNEGLQKFGLTTYKGAIRVPYAIYHMVEGGHIEQGEIRIAFSGAKEWQDLMLTVLMLQNFQRGLCRFWDTAHIWFNLSDLNQLPEVAMALHLVDVREIPG